MKRSLKGMIIGALVMAGAAGVSTSGQAMPVQPQITTASHTSDIEHVYWRGGYYGYRRGFFRGGYGWRGGYGFRGYGYGFRPFGYGYGWRRPFYGFGYRRW